MRVGNIRADYFAQLQYQNAARLPSLYDKE